MTDTQTGTPKPTPATPPPAKAAEPGTLYVVLYTTELDPKWGEHKRVTARTPEAAIKAAIGDKIPDGAAQFVAIPARSWKPVKVTEKVERSLVLGAVS
jgi:hypothetical protein